MFKTDLKSTEDSDHKESVCGMTIILTGRRAEGNNKLQV